MRLRVRALPCLAPAWSSVPPTSSHTNTHAPCPARTDLALLRSLAFHHSHEVASVRALATATQHTALPSPARLAGSNLLLQASPMALRAPPRSAAPGQEESPKERRRRLRREATLLEESHSPPPPDAGTPFAETAAMQLMLQSSRGPAASTSALRSAGFERDPATVRLVAARARKVLRVVAGRAFLYPDELLNLGAVARSLRHVCLAEITGLTLRVRFLRSPGVGSAVAAWLACLPNLRSLGLGQVLEVATPTDCCDLLEGLVECQQVVALAAGGHVELPALAHTEAQAASAGDVVGSHSSTVQCFSPPVVACLTRLLSRLAPKLKSLAFLPTMTARLTAPSLALVLPPLLSARRLRSFVWAGLTLPGNTPPSLLPRGAARDIAMDAAGLGGMAAVAEGAVVGEEGSDVQQAHVLGQLLAPLLRTVGPRLRELDTGLWIPSLRGWYSDRYASLHGEGTWAPARAASAVAFMQDLARGGRDGLGDISGLDEAGGLGGGSDTPSTCLWEALCSATSLAKLHLCLPADKFDAGQAAAVVATSADTLTSLRISAPSHIHFPHSVSEADEADLRSLRKRRGSAALGAVLRLDARSSSVGSRTGGPGRGRRRSSVAVRPAADPGTPAQVGFDADPHIPSFVFSVLEPTADTSTEATNPVAGEDTRGPAQVGLQGADVLPASGALGGTLASKWAYTRSNTGRMQGALARSGLTPSRALDGMSLPSDMHIEEGQLLYSGEAPTPLRSSRRGGQAGRGGGASPSSTPPPTTATSMRPEMAFLHGLADGDLDVLELVAGAVDSAEGALAQAAAASPRTPRQRRKQGQAPPPAPLILHLSEVEPLLDCGVDGLPAPLRSVLQHLVASHADKGVARGDVVITDGTRGGAAKSVVGSKAGSRRGSKVASTVGGSVFEGASAGAVADEDVASDGGAGVATGLAKWITAKHLTQLALSSPSWLLCDAVRMDEGHLPQGRSAASPRSRKKKTARFADEAESASPRRGVSFGDSDDGASVATGDEFGPGRDDGGQLHLRPLAATLAWCTELTELTLSHVSSANPGDDMQALAATLETSPLPLAQLNLRHTPLGHAGGAGLASALASAGNLHSLHITNCCLTDAGAAALGYTIGTAVTLNSFELSRDVTVSDAGATALVSGLLNCRRLNSLTLSELKITAGTVSMVGQSLTAWPLLKSLALNGHPGGSHAADWYDTRTPPEEWTWQGQRSARFEMAGGVVPPRPEVDVDRDANVFMPEMNPPAANTLMARAGVKALIKGLRHVSPLIRCELRHWGVPGNGMVAILSALRRSSPTLRCLDLTGTSCDAQAALALAAALHVWKDSLVYCAATLASPSAYTLYKFAHRYGQLEGGYPPGWGDDHPQEADEGATPHRTRTSRATSASGSSKDTAAAKNAEFVDALADHGTWGGPGPGKGSAKARRRSVAVATTAASRTKQRRGTIAVTAGRSEGAGRTPSFLRKGQGGGGGGGAPRAGSVGGWSDDSGGLASTVARRDTLARSKAPTASAVKRSVKSRRQSAVGGTASSRKSPARAPPKAGDAAAPPSEAGVRDLASLTPEEAAFALSYSTSHAPEESSLPDTASAGDDALFSANGLPPSAQAVLDRKAARAAKGKAGSKGAAPRVKARAKRVSTSFRPGTRAMNFGSGSSTGSPGSRGRTGTKSYKGKRGPASPDRSGSDAVSVVSFASFSTHTRLDAAVSVGAGSDSAPQTLGDVAAAVLMGRQGDAGGRSRRRGPTPLTPDHVSMLASAMGQCKALHTLSLSFTPHVAPSVVSSLVQRLGVSLLPVATGLRRLAVWRIGPVPESVLLPEPPAGNPRRNPVFAPACGGVASPTAVASLLTKLPAAGRLLRLGVQTTHLGLPESKPRGGTTHSALMPLPSAGMLREVPSKHGADSDSDSTATLSSMSEGGPSSGAAGAQLNGGEGAHLNLSETLRTVAVDAAASGNSLQFMYVGELRPSDECG